VHLLHLFFSERAHTAVGDELSYFVEFYFLFKIIGINHIVEFKVALNVLFVYTKLQFYGDNAIVSPTHFPFSLKYFRLICTQAILSFLPMFLVFSCRIQKVALLLHLKLKRKLLNFLLAR